MEACPVWALSHPPPQQPTRAPMGVCSGQCLARQLPAAPWEDYLPSLHMLNHVYKLGLVIVCMILNATWRAHTYIGV